MTAAQTFIDPTLPLVDLHRHLDGAVRLETILDLGLEHNLPLPARDLEGLRPFVQVTHSSPADARVPGVMAFIAKFEWMVGILVDYAACRRVAYENVQDLAAEGIDYAELRFSPWFMAEPHHLDPAGVVEAVVDGVTAGVRDFGVPARLIGIISRTYGPEAGRRELDALLTHRHQITALDLAGDEANWPAGIFQQHFARAREAGWHITVHAGESAGPASIWQALCELGAERIGHGVHAVEDPALIDYMGEQGIGVECCLTSNVQTSTVPSYPAHPARQFLERGLRVTLNTDDPGISAIDLRYEYEEAAPAAGLSPAHTRQAQSNGLAAAFLTESERAALLQTHAARR